MDHVEFVERPALDRPALICAFHGWNDGGEAASLAARYLVEQWSATGFAYLDPEDFYDFQVTRPTVRLEQGVSRIIEWPRGEFFRANVGGRDLVVFTAAEPNVRWRTYGQTIIDVAREIGSELLVTLGAFLTDVPHTRPAPVVGSAADEETARSLGLSQSQYQGPTGIVGVVHDASNRSGLQSVSLWAAVPHYLPAAPNPSAALSLVQQTCGLLDVTVDTTSLARGAQSWREGVDRLVAESEELAEYVQRLEGAADEVTGRQRLADQPVPSGDAIAAELERFLREQGGDEAEP